MKQKTLLLFQLFLAVFAVYAVLKFLIGKVETAVTEKDKKEEKRRARAGKGAEEKRTFKPVDCLLKSKNVLLLTDAIHHLLNDLGLKVSRSPDQSVIDRLIRASDRSQVTFGLKVLSDVGELSENWDSWGELNFRSLILARGEKSDCFSSVVTASMMKETASHSSVTSQPMFKACSHPRVSLL
jgi:hypothetical protein